MWVLFRNALLLIARCTLTSQMAATVMSRVTWAFLRLLVNVPLAKDLTLQHVKCTNKMPVKSLTSPKHKLLQFSAELSRNAEVKSVSNLMVFSQRFAEVSPTESHWKFSCSILHIVHVNKKTNLVFHNNISQLGLDWMIFDGTERIITHFNLHLSYTILWHVSVLGPLLCTSILIINLKRKTIIIISIIIGRYKMRQERRSVQSASEVFVWLTGIVWLPWSALMAITASAWLLNLTKAQPAHNIQHIIATDYQSYSVSYQQISWPTYLRVYAS